MLIDSEKSVNEMLTVAKRIATQEFGEEAAKRPEVVTAILQGLAAMEQVKAMDMLGNAVIAAADMTR